MHKLEIREWLTRGMWMYKRTCIHTDRKRYTYIYVSTYIYVYGIYLYISLSHDPLHCPPKAKMRSTEHYTGVTRESNTARVYVTLITKYTNTSSCYYEFYECILWSSTSLDICIENSLYWKRSESVSSKRDCDIKLFINMCFGWQSTYF